MTTIHPGRYRHYKGQEYTVIGVARHSESEEEFVVYRQEYGDHGLWVRPTDHVPGDGGGGRPDGITVRVSGAGVITAFSPAFRR